MANTKITNHIVDSTVITGQTAVTAADGDYILVADASDSNALKKVLASDLIQSSEEISDIVGAMVSSNTESGIAVAYQDSDNTLDFTVGAAQSSITSLGTLSALTVSGDLIVDTDTLKVTSGSDLVHIGNTSTGFHSSVHPLIVGSGSGDEGMTIFSGSSNKGKLGFADAASDDSGSYRGYIQYDHNGDKMNIGTAGGTRMHINDAGDVGIGTLTLNKFFNLADPNEGAETLKLHFEAAASSDSWAIYPYDRTNSHYPNLHLGANAAIKVKNTGAIDMIDSTCFVHQDGKVGIGTATPNRNLSVSTKLAKTSTTTAYPFAIQSNEASGNAQLSIHAIGASSNVDRKWLFQTEESGVANAGNIVFQPHGGTVIFGNTRKVGFDGTVNQYIVGTAANDKIEIFTNTSSVRALFNASGISGVINDTSDRALKENIVNLGTSTTTLKALTPRTFDWKAETDANDQTGFIAQEIEAVNSNLVSGEEGHKAINTIGILAIAVKTIQELEARITTLEG